MPRSTKLEPYAARTERSTPNAGSWRRSFESTGRVRAPISLRGLIPDERWPELEKRFAVVLGKKGFDVDDLDAARDYVASYVHFYKYAEGEDGNHHHGGHVHHH